MAEKYSLNDIFRYEDITKVYCASKGNQLSPQELVEMAAKEEKFDVDYAFYLHFKHSHQVTEFIKRRNRCLGNSLRFIDNDFWEEYEMELEPKIKAIPFKIKPTAFDILDVLIRDQQWDLVFYVYIKETSGLSHLISKLEDENIPKESVKDKKYFIFQ